MKFATGTEATRRAARPDNRPKDFLIPVKRFELARSWLATLFKERRPLTTRSLWKRPASIMIVTDASPQGCGGMLLIRATVQSQWTALKAYEYPVEQEDAALLGFPFKSHKSQSFLEALAVFLALREWGKLMASIKIGVAIRSDSTVALAILEKAASTSPALNYLAAEMALLLEKLQVGDLELSHVPGKMNVLADWLSRPESRGAMPSQLQGVKLANPKKLQRSDFSLGLARSHDASAAGASLGCPQRVMPADLSMSVFCAKFGATSESSQPVFCLPLADTFGRRELHTRVAHPFDRYSGPADHGAHSAPRGFRRATRRGGGLRPMAGPGRVPRLDGLHLPARSNMDRTATSQMGRVLGSAVDTGLHVVPTAKSSARTPRSRTPSRKAGGQPEPQDRPGKPRSRTPARSRSRGRSQGQSSSVCSAAVAPENLARQLVCAPGPLRQLQLRGGPCMLRWQGTHFNDSHSKANPATPTGLHMGAGNRGPNRQEGSSDSGTGGPRLGTGCGLWAHLGPADHTAVKAHGRMAATDGNQTSRTWPYGS